LDKPFDHRSRNVAGKLVKFANDARKFPPIYDDLNFALLKNKDKLRLARSLQ
jgi:hypothetical protein